MSAALALTDSTAEQARGSRSPFMEYAALRVTMLARLAAGTPERAVQFLEKVTDPKIFQPSRLYYHTGLSGLA